METEAAAEAEMSGGLEDDQAAGDEEAVEASFSQDDEGDGEGEGDEEYVEEDVDVGDDEEVYLGSSGDVGSEEQSRQDDQQEPQEE